MTQAAFQLDTLTPQNLQVMQAYSLRAATKKASAEGFDGWLERIDALPDLTAEMLTQLHGQLIAMGFLKFEIAGRNIGLRYQISPKGKQALDRALSAESTDSDAADGDSIDGDLTDGDLTDEMPHADAA
ncbi:MAG: hypothetical protein RIK87_08875 [Fuerstiella sp.]